MTGEVSVEQPPVTTPQDLGALRLLGRVFEFPELIDKLLSGHSPELQTHLLQALGLAVLEQLRLPFLVQACDATAQSKRTHSGMYQGNI